MDEKEEKEKLEQEVKLAPELDFDVPSEPWVMIRVKDGAELRAKLIVIGVKRISDNPETGEPRYFIGHEVKVRVTRRPGRLER